MNYPSNIAEKLGFQQIQEQIKSLCLSKMGAEYADKMKFSNRFALVQLNQGKPIRKLHFIRIFCAHLT